MPKIVLTTTQDITIRGTANGVLLGTDDDFAVITWDALLDALRDGCPTHTTLCAIAEALDTIADRLREQVEHDNKDRN